MEWHSSLLTQKQFEEAEKQERWKGDYNPILFAQAQKSYKAGERKVVEFVEYCIKLPELTELRTEHFGNIFLPQWQAFKKENGYTPPVMILLDKEAE